MVDEKGISWLEILTALWAAGVGIVLMWNLCAGAVYQKRLRRWERENGKCRRTKAKGATGDQAGDFPFTLLSSFNAYAGGTF